jgi:hypothetical protein
MTCRLGARDLPPDLNDRALTKFITGASGTAELFRLWKMYRSSLNHLHVAAMMNSLAKVDE